MRRGRREARPRDVRATAEVRPAVSYTAVVPAYNAERTVGSVVTALLEQDAAPKEVIVVDDHSTDETAEVARAAGARVIRPGGRGYAGGARNSGWDAADADVVVFVDADVVVAPGWSAGLMQALAEYPGGLIGCARRFTARTPWGWVAHLQVETPYLARGVPREVSFVSSFCLAVPRMLGLRWDESYGGEDGLFSARALAAGHR